MAPVAQVAEVILPPLFTFKLPAVERVNLVPWALLPKVNSPSKVSSEIDPLPETFNSPDVDSFTCLTVPLAATLIFVASPSVKLKVPPLTSTVVISPPLTFMVPFVLIVVLVT